MKRIIIILVVVVLLGGGGAAFYFLNGGSDRQTDGETGEVAALSGDDPLFLEIDSLAIPIIRDRRVERHILLRVMLEMADEASMKKAHSKMPRLKDAFIKDMYDYFAYQTPGRDGIDVDIVKKRLERAAARAVGEGKVRQVLIQAAFERGARSK